MPQVPYNPVPTVGPSGQGAPALEPRVPAAAFGVGIGEAMESVGGNFEKAGNELFSRAMALQELENRAASDKATMDFVEEMGKRHAEFSALQGDAARQELPKYIQDINDLRERYGQNLNPMAKRYYDSESRGQAARTIFNGAGHAATQFKDYQISNATAQVNLAAKTIDDNPTDELSYREQVLKATFAAQNKAQLQGQEADSPYAKDLTAKAVSQVTLTRILSVAKTEPMKAMGMYKQLQGALYGADRLHAETAVMGQYRSAGAANIAQSVFNDMYDENGKPKMSLTEAEAAAKAKAREFSPNDDIFVNNTVRTLQTLNTRKFQAEKVDDWQSEQGIRDIITAHPEIKTEQDLRALPEARALLDSMHFKGRGMDAPGYLHRYIESKFKEVNEETYYRLKGVAARDRDQFLDIDFTKEQLNNRQIDSLNQLRKKLIQHPDDDPHVRNALKWMQDAKGGELESLGIFRRTQDNKDDYDKYVGAMTQAIDIWQKNNQNKVPGMKDIVNEIGPEVIRTHGQKGWFGTYQVPQFKLDVPAEFKKQILKEFPERYSGPNGQLQLERDYQTFTFQKLFGATVAPAKVVGGQITGGDNAVTNAPVVPTSK